jgi:hypothetical protein
LRGAGAAIGFHASTGPSGGFQSLSSTPGSRSNFEHPSRACSMQPAGAHVAMRDDRSIERKCRQYRQGVAEAMAGSWQAAGSWRELRQLSVQVQITCEHHSACVRIASRPRERQAHSPLARCSVARQLALTP